ncbi:hypothetical protein PGT21_005617 [Puccinia graminis f. sp. tritici]|uniref:Uncharacterized protein n=1 Tax=Puccinia graminis f. sp. tritici TaxID=56615 RepID=A0A5B0MDY8_PUCGR|nr:hypothetical protein PGT21_005617 [Puccinia graminis f. sp. tritici]
MMQIFKGSFVLLSGIIGHLGACDLKEECKGIYLCTVTGGKWKTCPVEGCPSKFRPIIWKYCALCGNQKPTDVERCDNHLETESRLVLQEPQAPLPARRGELHPEMKSTIHSTSRIQASSREAGQIGHASSASSAAVHPMQKPTSSTRWISKGRVGVPRSSSAGKDTLRD